MSVIINPEGDKNIECTFFSLRGEKCLIGDFN